MNDKIVEHVFLSVKKWIKATLPTSFKKVPITIGRGPAKKGQREILLFCTSLSPTETTGFNTTGTKKTVLATLAIVPQAFDSISVTEITARLLLAAMESKEYTITSEEKTENLRSALNLAAEPIVVLTVPIVFPKKKRIVKKVLEPLVVQAKQRNNRKNTNT